MTTETLRRGDQGWRPPQVFNGRPGKGGAPGKTAREKAQEHLDKPDLVDPEDIDDPEVRQAYVDGLFEDEFGGKPSYKASKPEPAPVETSPSPGPAASQVPVPGRSGPVSGAAGRTRPSSRSTGATSSTSWPTPTLSPSLSDGTGFALGMVLYALGLNYIRYGPAGVKGWLSAKFLNRPAVGLLNGLTAGDKTTSGKGTGVPTGGSGNNRAF